MLAFHLGRALDLGHVSQFRRDPIHYCHAQLRMRDLTPAEHEGDLDLVLFLQEPSRVPRLRVEVVSVDPRAVLHFLELDDVLLLLRDPRPFGLFELELPEVHDPDHWWTRRRGYFHEVESMFLGQCHGLFCFHDSELRPIMADHAYWADADLSIDANAFGCVLNGNVSCAWVTRQALARRGTKKIADPVGAHDARTTARYAVSRIQ